MRRRGRRGSNENLNRIVREYFPQGVELTSDPAYLAMVAAEINDRSRKIHGRNPPRYSPSSSRQMLRPPELALDSLVPR